VAWPEASVPTLQLSLVKGLDPTTHLDMGRALAPLRDDNVLIVGSGMSPHNLRVFGDPRAIEPSRAFDRWLRETVGQDAHERDRRLTQWSSAPAARLAHPREEHLLPLMVAAGAAGTDPAAIAWHHTLFGFETFAVRFEA
jgi:aromatic ring-opening dioxygenase catalytic subunit (LigB family)